MLNRCQIDSWGGGGGFEGGVRGSVPNKPLTTLVFFVISWGDFLHFVKNSLKGILGILSQTSIRSHSVGKQLFALKLESFVQNPFCKRDLLKSQGHLGTRTLHWVDLHQDKSILVRSPPKGAGKKVPRENCRKVSKNFLTFLTIFDIFCLARQLSKSVEKLLDTFWRFLTFFDVRALSAGPFCNPLIGF